MRLWIDVFVLHLEYGNYNSGGTAYGGYAGYSQPAPAAGGAGAATAAAPNYPSTQGYDQSGYNQQGSWGQQQGYGNYGTTGDQTSYSQQGYMDSYLYFLYFEFIMNFCMYILESLYSYVWTALVDFIMYGVSRVHEEV